ncbi:MAG: AAA family ATPase [Desulfamplus sp.]|nr:AAA family ATPase [Desulfamplus sp.]
MGDLSKDYQIFKHGSTWLRADFHLHTKADKEFQYDAEENSFITDYVAALKAGGIQLGVITNHNKFDAGEFKALRKKAKQEEIYLLPGVELSVNDGANGIHTLIVFNEKWLENENDYISSFINTMFLGKAVSEYQSKNGRSDKNTLQVVEELDKVSKDYFIIPDHIELNQPCYLKLGAFSFDAVKFALIDYKSRVCKKIKPYKHSYIKSISFELGRLSGKEINFSPELNTLIGIRGSGKSSILEVIRYVLDIPFGDKAGDIEYKKRLVAFIMGSGGRVVINAVDRYGEQYQIRRVWKENFSDVLIDNKLQPGVSIRETVIHKPIYFGQKDLSATGEGFEKDLVDKLIGSKLDLVRHEIDDQKIRVCEIVDRLTKVVNIKEQIEEQRDIKLDTEHRLKFYKDHGVEEKLQKRLDFDTDIRTLKKGVSLVDEFVAALREILARYEDDIRNFAGYTSKHNPELFERFYSDYSIIIEIVYQIRESLTKADNAKDELGKKSVELDEIRKSLVEEFADIERKLAIDLKSNNTHHISSDEFLSLKKKLAIAEQLISEFSKQETQKRAYEELLREELHKLNELWHKEFTIIKNELDKVGEKSSSLSIVSGYKEDKHSFINFMKDLFKGSGVREAACQRIAENYQDFIGVYNDLENAEKHFGSNSQTVKELIQKNLKTVLTYQTPNSFTITYRGKELQQHSLGQRASALILFVLSQQEHDVVIIDQPEDDLDNQTIYEDVIKLIRQIKSDVQFIFATHNPNIPVLGDAEQVFACSFMDDTVSVNSGSVDDLNIQKAVVEIMEGGKEAFNRRKEIYQIWKP